MDELTAWSRDLTVEVGGHGVVSHTGSAALRLLADRTGLTGALSRALRRRGFTPVHDRGRVLADTAVLHRRRRPGAVGPGGAAGSGRAVRAGGLGPDAVAGPGGDRPGPAGPDRRRAGQGPPARVGADRGPARADPAVAGGRPRPRGDDRDPAWTPRSRSRTATNSRPPGTFKGTWGHHSLTAWCDNTSAAPRGVAVSDGGEMTLVVPPS